MFFQYASFRPQISAPVLTTTTGGATAIAHDYTYYLQLQNRAGKNLLSAGVSLLVPAGNKLIWTIPPGLIEDGEDVFWYVLSAHERVTSIGIEQNPCLPDNSYCYTTPATEAVVLAKIQARDADQTTLRSLPLSLELTSDADFLLSGVVANESLLPLTAANGSLRYVNAIAKYYYYDSEAIPIVSGYSSSYGVPFPSLNDNWIETTETFSSWQASTTTGSDLVLADAENALSPPPKTNLSTTPVRIWLLNGYALDGLSPVAEGSKYHFVVAVNGEDRSNLFYDKIVATHRGVIERATGERSLNIWANEQFVWSNISPILVREDLERGYAIALDVEFVFDNEELLGAIPVGAVISFTLVSANTTTTSEVAGVTGDLVLAEGDKLLVVPDKRLGGKATILPTYVVNPSVEQPLQFLLQADTVNQLVTINGAFNGFSSVRQQQNEVLPSERIRAVVGTEPGICQLVASTNLTLSSGDRLEVLVGHPYSNTTQRGMVSCEYPDLLIRGNLKATFTPSYCYIFIEKGGVFYQSPQLAVTQTESQSFFFDDLSTFTTITNLPNPAANFGLFEVNTIELLTSTGGAFTAGTVVAYFAYVYNTPNRHLTTITHASPPATIGTAGGSLTEVLSASLLRANNLSDLLSVSTARTNLGLGTAATKNVGTAIANVLEIIDMGGGVPGLPVLDGSNLTGINASGFAVYDLTNPGNPILYSPTSSVFPGATYSITGGGQLTINAIAPALLKVNNLSDLPNISTARTNLGAASATDLTTHTSNTNNPHSTTAVSIGALTASSNLGDIPNISTARTNLGLGTAATKNTGTAIANVVEVVSVGGIPGLPVLDGSNLIGVASPLETTDGTDSVTATTKLNFSGAKITDNGNGEAIVSISIGAGVILLPNSQSLFLATNNTNLTAYSPEVGTQTWADIKILSSANTPSNQIINNQLVISQPNTGAVINLGDRDTVLEFAWQVTAGDNLCAIARYQGTGNMMLISFTETAIALESVINNTITTLSSTPYTFTPGTTYSLQVRVIGVIYQVSVSTSPGNWAIELQDYSSLFLDEVRFGVGKK